MSDCAHTALTELLAGKILVLDGAMGTMIQAEKLTESDFRSDQFKDHQTDLLGNNDILSLTQPDCIVGIHNAFLESGADIISTNSFNASSVSQADYKTDTISYDINRAAAQLARQAVNTFRSDSKRFVAGSMGPTNKSCSMSPDVDNPGYRAITFDQMAASYKTQAEGLIDGGVDLLLIETIFDTLNAKAAIFAIKQLFEEKDIELPLWISGTIVDKSGRILSGQTFEAFYNSVRHANPFCIGINCALGARTLRPFLQELSGIADIPVSIHPNAGLPDVMGDYPESPEDTAGVIRQLANDGLVNIVGGCCGTTPEHITAIAKAVKDISPRAIPTVAPVSRLSGLEPLTIQSDSLFVNIGERTNVAGSKKFAKLIKAGNYDAALTVARKQVEKGAQIIDVNMDDAMLDAKAAMVDFLNMAASDPDISRVPVMVDSSDFSVIEAGLQCLQGKGIVNSISLKDGEEEFVRRAKLIQQYGAAVVVMAFDEHGQAVDYQHKIDIGKRAYTILTEQAGFAPQDIIFDTNVLTVATGIEEHCEYANAFIEAVRTLKKTLPGCLTSAGVSNLSFAFRGNNTIREAMHAVFLYHAVRAGLDMGIVNAGQLVVYEEIPADLRNLVEDVILNRHPEATAQLTDKAVNVKSTGKRQTDHSAWRDKPLEGRLVFSLINGIADHIEHDINEALTNYDNPVAIIDGPLMDGMNEVGDLFGAGKMFLPQVIKSARVMKKAVAILQPHLKTSRQQKNSNAGKVLLATVRGDVHDIGKNITKIVMECNNYEVHDLGVMVPADTILDSAIEEKADVIGLSGLITPSLEEMRHIAEEMERREFTTPLLIGGATTSRLHTAVKIDTQYSAPIVHVPDASKSVKVLSELMSKDNQVAFAKRVKNEYAGIRKEREERQDKTELLSLSDARENKPAIDWTTYSPPIPKKTGTLVYNDYDIETVVPFIDWTPLFTAFDLPGRYPRILDYKHLGDEPRKLFGDAQKMLKRVIDEKTIQARAVIGLFPANAVNDDIAVFGDDTRQNVLATVHFLRQQKKTDKPNLCLSDFIAPNHTGKKDFIGGFAVSAGFGVDDACNAYIGSHDDYNAILLRALADRLAEAMAENLHRRVRQEFWGYEKTGTPGVWDESEKCVGIRPAPGYPACPDHTEKELLFKLLNVTENIGLGLTENYIMTPLASVSGWYFSHPDSWYFAVGRIGQDQLTDYAERKGLREDEARRWLSPNLY